MLRALDAKAKGNPPRHGPRSFPSVPYGDPIRVEPPAADDLRVGAELEAAFAQALEAP